MTVEYKKRAKREKILSEGIQLLLRQGYHGTGVKELLDTVGIPKGSFYSYFQSKEEFTAEAIAFYIKPFIDELTILLRVAESEQFSALKQYFHSQIKQLEASNFQTGCLLGDMMGEICSSSDSCRQALLTAINEYCAIIETALLAGQKNGTVRVDIHAQTLSMLLFNSWQGALLAMKLHHSITPLNEWHQYMLNHYCKLSS